jgi:hypothetical protein
MYAERRQRDAACLHVLRALEAGAPGERLLPLFAEAGLLGVAGFAKAAVLGAVLLGEGVGGGGEALPAAERDAARDAKEAAGEAGKRGGGVKRRRSER